MTDIQTVVRPELGRKKKKEDPAAGRPACAYRWTGEDPKTRRVATEDCSRPASCPVCGCCVTGEKTGHCPGHVGLLVRSTEWPTVRTARAVLPRKRGSVRTVLDLTPDESERVARLAGQTWAEVVAREDRRRREETGA